ncbi:MAG: type II secretion system GspH family protein [Sphingopyxis sp.]|nr:type II secretion system GspH family protein [Sphingopyxis sp.]
MMDRERGFTLIELLVAMAAASLLVVALISATHGLTSRVRAPDPAAQARDQLRAGTALARLVERAVPSGEAGAFVLSESRLSFPALLTDGQAYVATIRVRESGSGSDLVVMLEDGGRPVAGSEEILFAGARAIRIEARDIEASSGVRRLDGVQVVVTPREGKEFVLAAASRVDALPGCRFDPVSLECRTS